MSELARGGLVPANAKLAKGEAVDNVVARAYRHPVLPGRTIIRLTAEGVAAGDDLEMAVLGFAAGESRGVVAKERRRPLGFPGWALVHDPKNARYALDVVKELKKAARKAKAKPGAAKELLDAIAEKLGRTVPHFLPSFFEEAGRVFIEHGSPTFAAGMFGRAREAEAVHALEVDEQHRVDGFLEFALAGAVTTKALTQYAKDLGDSHEPAVAYGHFRQLCVQRTLGGMPPWSGMAKELAKLAKAAKLDPIAEARTLVADIIDSPALAKGASEFWRAYQPAFAELGRHSETARGILLNLFPTGNTYSADLDEVWLDLVTETGADAALVGDAPEDTRPTSGRAAWFDRLTAHLARNRKTINGPRTFALLRRMAPMLIADGQPIACLGRYHQIDLDLLELALELGVPVRRASDHARFDLGDWAQHVNDRDRGRDPVLTAAHPVLGPVLVEAVYRSIGEPAYDTASAGKRGFLAAKRTWLAHNVDRAERGGMLALEEVIELVNTKIKAATFAELPDLHARFAAIDATRSLARSLRIGLLDELGWPALEDAAAELDPDGKAAVTIHGGLPAVVVASKTRAIAVGPRGRLGEHDLVIPSKHELFTARFIGGAFLIILKHNYSDVRAYWSTAPHDHFASEVSTWGVPTIANRACVLADGGWLEGKRVFRAGDRHVPDQSVLAASDGVTHWILEQKDGTSRYREVSATGELGRASKPSFLEVTSDDDRVLVPAASYVLPAPGLDASPLGLAEGLLGTRVRTKAGDATRVVERIDGATWTGALGAVGLVTLPGGGAPRPYVEEARWRELTAAVILDPATDIRGSYVNAKHARYTRGSVVPYPPALWHALVPRDVAGSTRLRALTDDEARALIALVPADEVTAAAEAVVARRIGEVLPIAHPRLAAGIAGLVVHAAQLGIERAKIATERAPGAITAAPSVSGLDEAQLVEALYHWHGRSYGTDGRVTTQIASFAELCRSSDRSDRVITGASQVGWIAFAATPSALAVLALAAGTPHRETIVALLEVLAELPPDNLRAVVATGAAGRGVNCELSWHAGNAYAIRSESYSGNALAILEYAPDGVFKPLPGTVITSERRAQPFTELAALRAALGTTSWSPAAVARIAAATGLAPSEAAILWAGHPRVVEKELRDQLGLKAAQVALGRDGLKLVPFAKRLAVLDETGRAGIAALLDGSAAEVFAAAWNRIVGARVPIPEELIAEAGREVLAPIEPGPALAMFATAHESPLLQLDGTWALDAKGEVIRASKPEPLVGQTTTLDDTPVFTAAVMHTANAYIPFLFAELPVGHPLRALAVTAHEAVLARLASPALLLDAGHEHVDDLGELDQLISGLGGTALVGLDGEWTGSVVPGAVVVRRGNFWRLRLRPAVTAANVAALATRIQGWRFGAWVGLSYTRSADRAALVARITKTPVPAGGWEQNPLASAPALVTKAAKRFGVSKDAAALYLQFLALLWPIPKLLMQWNGWSTKQLTAATAELVEHELVLPAKRERAQRGHFLPGGWEALKSPNPPMETWKLPLYGTRDPDGAPVAPLGRFFAMAPFHMLFERAWKRIEADDVPRYDEVKR